jgi:hypothetical protein
VRLLRVMQACSLAHSPTNRDGWICTTDAQGAARLQRAALLLFARLPDGHPLGSPLACARGCAISALPRSVCHVSEIGSATGTCAPLSPIPTGCVALYALAEQSGAGGAEETLAHGRAAG